MHDDLQVADLILDIVSLSTVSLKLGVELRVCHRFHMCDRLGERIPLYT